MAVRSGMKSLIRRLRQMCEAGPSDYSLNGTTYWSDEDLQDKLDEARRQVIDVPLVQRPQYVSGAYVYKRYEIPRSVGNAVEGVASGSMVFRVYDSGGVDVDEADYSFNENDLTLEFSVDTEGTDYYWDGFVYDLQAAAREIWLAKAAHMHQAIDFQADGHRFDREAMYKHCIEMAEFHGMQRGGSNSNMTQVSRLVRTDLNAHPGSPL